MSYIYATENINYEDYSSGRILYNQQGATSFPVRLSCEIFLRCEAIMKKSGIQGPYKIYDPLCGGAYSLTTLGFIYSSRISKIFVSDIDDIMIGLANKNLSLLTEEGLKKRIQQIEQLLDEYGKESHREALQSGAKFKELINKMSHQIDTHCFVCDAIKTEQPLITEKMDMVITDLPYGEVVDWVNVQEEGQAIKQLLLNLLPSLTKHSVVAITARKNVDIRSEKYRRVDRFVVGKRKIILLQPIFE